MGRRPPIRISVPEDQKSGQQQTLHLDDRKVNQTVEKVRGEVDRWRDDGYPNVTATTRRLLHHWTDPQAMIHRLFFAQVEAAETLIWLREVATRQNPVRRELEAEARKHNDGIVRLCAKMATGTGKTAVMGMVIAWQTLNAARSTRTRNIMHTDRFVVFAPGHTVRERLGVLLPSDPNNVYDDMGIVPHDMRQDLNRAKVRVVNFQAFTQKDLINDGPARKLLGKGRGDDVESWEAAVGRVLGDLTAGAERSGVCVINDEAHHCYLPPERKRARADQDEDRRAAVWFNAIRALRGTGVLGRVDAGLGQAHPVLDFSATPLWIDTASKSEPEQFQWVASDFGLMDAIESGLVKVPRVPIDDDSTRDETVWRRLHQNTQPKKLPEWFAAPDNAGRLPEALGGAVAAVIEDWKRTLNVWQGDTERERERERERDQPTPPVVIFVVDNIRNATALYEHLAGKIEADSTARPGAHAELSNVDEHGNWHSSPRTLVVHSKVAEGDTIPDPLKTLLVQTAGLDSKKDAEAAVREMLNTVGKPGQPGADVRCVVSVAMLTEGWDARTVTHIVGFRAFSTQLLCEQVTGRALRRTSYDALRDADDGRQLLEPEYADVVGIPFEFMPGAGQPNPAPKPPKPRTRVHTLEGRRDHRVAWPQVTEYVRVAPQARFALELDRVKPWKPNPQQTATTTALQGSVGEESIISSLADGDRQRTAQMWLASEIASHLTIGAPSRDPAGNQAEARQQGRASLFRSALAAVGQWAAHPNVVGDPAAEVYDLRTVVADPANRLEAAEAVLDACDFGAEQESPRRARLAQPAIFDTARVDFETTLAHIHETRHSELSHAACHSKLELLCAEALDADPRVAAWARNFQLGWSIPYWDETVWRRYEPDFVARLDDGMNLIVECKGAWDDKATAAKHWTEDHWIPCVAGTAELPDGLRRWHYGVIDDDKSVRHQLDLAIKAALKLGAT